MTATARRTAFLGLAFLVVLTGCAATTGMRGPGADLIKAGRYDEAISQLSAAAAAHPGDLAARRNLGIARLKNGDAAGAVKDLTTARGIKPDDPPTLFFLGQAAEAGGDFSAAGQAYEAYLADKPNDVQVRSRLREVNLKKIRAEMDLALKREREISASDIPENTLAVMEFRNLSSSEELAPLSKGLSAMVTGDLAKVQRYRVVERQKLSILMDEIKLGSSTVEMTPRGTTTPITTSRGLKERLAAIPRKDGSGRPYYGGAVDDAADQALAQAVRDFQKDAGLTVDGKVGPRTRSAMADAYAAWLGTGKVIVPAMDKSSVPRVGKILGARLLVQGGFSGTLQTPLRIDAGMTESTTGEARGSGADVNGPLADLFRMEKELVYKLLDQLGVTLTKEEKDAIGRLPTRNVNAFLAWSQGLDFEDRGQLDQAREAYGRALRQDPGFQLAREHLQAVSGTPEGFTEVGGRMTDLALGGGGAGGGGDAARDRLDMIGAINGRGLSPGRSDNDQLNPTVTPVASAGGAGTIIIQGEVPR